MLRNSLPTFLTLALLLSAGPLWAQQPMTAQTQLQPAAPNPPFVVPPEYQKWLDNVLVKWEQDSATVTNFYCDFERDVHNIAGPSTGGPFAKEKGKLGYHKPDKGSFQITESLVWTPKAKVIDPNQPTQTPATQEPAGEYLSRKDVNGKEEPGEHWVCNGKNVYQYRNHDKKLVVTPIPPELQGQQIVNGPLPFLFGAKADDLKQRFWLEPAKELCNDKFIGIHAKPKHQVNAAEYSDVWVVLRNEPGKPLMPAGIRVLHPNKSWDEYRFNLKDAQVNGRLAGLLASLFQEPRTPWGWERVEEPMRQAQNLQPAPK